MTRVDKALLLPSWIRGVILVIFAAGLIVTLAVLWRYLLPPGPGQPVPFSHRLHVSNKKLQCAFCHNSAARSTNAGMPSSEKCLLCHSVIASNFSPIRKLLIYTAKREAVPWKRVSYLPGYVRFSHQAHTNERIDCGYCHGNVAGMDRVEQVHNFDMNFCVTCHWKRHESTSCDRCHY